MRDTNSLNTKTGAAMAVMGSAGGSTVGPIPVFALCATLAFAINWLASIPAVLISPVFVTILLTLISGVPPLERQADERWGGQPDYEDYKRQTLVLVPRPPTRRAS